MSIYKKLLQIQIELKAPKSQYNFFGKYRYRNCEDILEALKPILQKTETILYITDELVLIGERYYIKAIVTLIDIETGETISSAAYAREEEAKKGMDSSQVTGAASSYARKYALNGLFNINDVRDNDALLPPEQQQLPPSQVPEQRQPAQQLTQPQINRLFAIAYNAGYTSEETENSVYTNYQKEIKDLSKKEYDRACIGFEQHPKKPPQVTQGKMIQAEKQKKIKQVYELGKRCGYSETQVNQKVTTDYKKNIFDITEKQIEEITKWLRETEQAKEKQKEDKTFSTK